MGRSDHDPFWKQGLPAVPWTDTAEFRNPNDHGAGDLPETLDYAFMADITRLLLIHLARIEQLTGGSPARSRPRSQGPRGAVKLFV